jgi:hypothetical protein
MSAEAAPQPGTKPESPADAGPVEKPSTTEVPWEPAGRAGHRWAAPTLLREQTFRRFWIGQTVSLFGDQVSLLAIPLTAVLVLHAGAAQMGT